MRNYCPILLLLLLVSCNEPSEHPSSNDDVELILSDEVYTFQLYQRKETTIQTSSGSSLTIGIDDITHGQTQLTLQLNNKTLVSKSIVGGDVVDFEVGTTTYSLICVDQVNHLIGEDYAFFELMKASANTSSMSSSDYADEHLEIEAFITKIEQSNVTFVRNGVKHTPKEAADHLRSKWNNSGQQLSLAQFIEHIASKSSLSGSPYEVILENGETVTAKEWYATLLETD